MKRTVVLAICFVMAGEGAAAQFPRIAPPPPCTASPAAAQRELVLWSSERQRGHPRLAVLPLQPEIEDAARVHMAVSISDRVRQRLAASPRLNVATDGSVARAMADARDLRDSAATILGVDYLLEGRITIVGTRQEVQVALRRPTTSDTLWRASFRSTTSLMAMEEAIVSGLSRALSAGDPAPRAQGWPSSPEAYEAVAAGDVYFRSPTRAGADSAAMMYRRAFELEPSSAVAATRLARAWIAVLERGGAITEYPGIAGTNRIFWLTSQALASDSTSAEAWTARALLARVLDPVAFEGAIQAHRRAVALGPRDADAQHEYGVTLMRLGDVRGAQERFARALTLEPSRASTLAALSELELRAEDWNAACALSNASIGAWPYDPLPYAVRAQARLRLSDARNAFPDAELARRMTASPWSAALRVIVTSGTLNRETARQQAMGLTASYLAPNRALSPRDAEYLALAYLAVGDRRRAVESLKRARPVGADLGMVLRHPGLSEIRSDTAVVRLAREIAEKRGQGTR